MHAIKSKFMDADAVVGVFIIFLQQALTPEQRQFAVRGVPTLLEVTGFVYFYGAFMVGPQFSMTQYHKLTRGELTDVPGQRPNR